MKYNMDFSRHPASVVGDGDEIGCSCRRIILGRWASIDRRLVTRRPFHPSALSILPFPPMRALRGFVGSRPPTTPEPQPSTSAVFPSLRKLDLPTDQSHASPILTLNLSAPSFLDAVVKDEFSDSPLYIIETHRDRTGIYRCETENITSVAKVQWPSRSKMISANAVALSGVSVQIHGGRWRPAEEFLKFGSLFTYVSPFPSDCLSPRISRKPIFFQFSQI